MPAPVSLIAEKSIHKSAGTSNQKLKLLRRGKLISITLIIIGKNQFPNPPIATGITIKKIINIAWAVTITLYVWSPTKNEPLEDSSNRINLDNLVPIKPPQPPVKI